jgi:hypothetical protein
MDLCKLHELCKADTRKAFEELKRVLPHDVYGLPPVEHKELVLNDIVNSSFGNTTKTIIMEYNPSEAQIGVMMQTIKQYKELLIKTSKGYYKKHIK